MANPQLIPDVVAYRHLFGVLATSQATRSQDDTRRRSYLKAFFRNNCGAARNEDRTLSDDQITGLLTTADTVNNALTLINRKIAALRQKGQVSVADHIALLTERDAAVSTSVTSLMAADPIMASKVLRHVQEHVKRRIKVNTIEIRHPTP